MYSASISALSLASYHRRLGLEGPDEQTVSCVDVSVALQQQMDRRGRGLQRPTAVTGRPDGHP